MEVTAREFRAKASEYVRRAAGGEAFTLTRDGQPLAVLEPLEAPAGGLVREAPVAYVAAPRGVEPGSIGVRALKSELSGVLDRSGSGEEFIVTDRGVNVARIRPVRRETGALPTRLRRMIAAGTVNYRGPLRLEALPPAVRVEPVDGKTLADIVGEMRG